MRQFNLSLEDPSQPLAAFEKWSPSVQIKLWLFFCTAFVLLNLLPNSIWDPEAREIVYVIGILGIWRYAWWFNHWIRALIFEKITYPKRRDAARALWEFGLAATPHPRPDDDLSRAS